MWGSVKTDKHPLKKYPVVGACGLNCGLCPRYHSAGASRCPGCCGPDFWQKHPGCAVITCCVKQRNLETCAECPDWTGCAKAAKRLDWGKSHDSVISYRPLTANFAFIQAHGIDEFARLEMEKQKLLKHLIENYDDGRAKSFYCTSCQLLSFDKLKEAVVNAEAKIPKNADIKTKASVVRAAINSLADALQVDLKLRK